jgi:transposase InsO family protein
MRAELVRDALAAAVAARGGRVDGVIFHSDSEYVSYRMFPGLLTRTAMDGLIGLFQDVRCRDALAAS